MRSTATAPRTAATLQAEEAQESGEAFGNVQYTGRQIIVFDDVNNAAENVRSMRSKAGVRMASSGDFETDPGSLALAPNEGIYYEALGVAVVNAPPAQVLSATERSRSGNHQSVIAERYYFPPGRNDDYLRGYRDGTNRLVESLFGSASQDVEPNHLQAAASPRAHQYTWGLTTTGAATSRFTGRGIKVAVLDTGFDTAHPDFAGRAVTTQSFVPNESVADIQGHGTHCIGTACGPRMSASGPGYGCASAAEIYAGKVLGNNGSGIDEWILNGIEWALRNGCHIISMSLCSPYDPKSPSLPQYERAGRVALRQGCLIVAAAGNESSRPYDVQPVGNPASASSIMAVAAVNNRLAVADFSCAGAYPPAGAVDISGPGVDVESSWPMPRRRRRLDGTSMATPHVAGIAALHAESDGQIRGMLLWKRLQASARPLAGGVADVGVGLVIAPA